MIQRHLSEAILQDSRLYKVIGITGPRQSGKTTLMKALFSGRKYANLEDLSQREFAESDPRGFLSPGRDGMMIDEIQRVPALLSYIQAIVDERDTPGQYVISGSQNMLLMEQVSQTLAGRISLFTLLPFSISELYRDRASIPPLEEVLFKGLYPAIHARPFDPPRYYRNYTATYVERDVRQLKQITDLGSFQNFIRLCAGRVGQVVNYSSLGDDSGITHNTAKAWLSLLETSFLVFPLRPYHRNFGKQIIRMPKLYFNDTGLLCALLGIDSPAALSTHFLRGGIFENLVINKFRKSFLHRAKVPAFFFWRDRRGREIDLLLDRQTKRTAIEMKSGATVSPSFFEALDYYRTLDDGLDPGDCYLVYGGEEEQDRSRGKVRSWKTLIDIPSTFGI